MSDDDKTAGKKPEPEILNPRYAGATPKMVGRALLRPVPKADEEDDGHKPNEPTA